MGYQQTIGSEKYGYSWSQPKEISSSMDGIYGLRAYGEQLK